MQIPFCPGMAQIEELLALNFGIRMNISSCQEIAKTAKKQARARHAKKAQYLTEDRVDEDVDDSSDSPRRKAALPAHAS